MRIELENLEGGKGDFAHVYQPDDLNPVDERISLTQPATVSGNVRLAGNEVFVNGHVETRARVECDRCLQPVETPVNTDFALEYITDSETKTAVTQTGRALVEGHIESLETLWGTVA